MKELGDFMGSVPIYVVSLASDRARRQQIEQRMRDQELSFEFFDAAKGRAKLEDLGLEVDDGYILKRRGYPLTDGEVGCFLSHYMLWMRCVEDNTPMVVLEDDAVVLDGFPDIYRRVDKKDFDYIKLEKRSTGKAIDADLMVLDQNKSGTVGYFIRPRAAKQLINASKPIKLPVDNFIGAIWWHGVWPVGVQHAVVGHSDSWESNIQIRRKAAEASRKYTLPVRFQRRLHRFLYSLNYKFFMFRNR